MHKLLPKWLKIIIYKFGGRKPFSKGYTTFKFSYVKRVIDNPEIMSRFKNSQPLPGGYGYALDDRVVEYPWVLSRVPQSNESYFLDAGSALNFEEILGFPALKNKKVVIINLNPEENCFLQNGISYILGDIRDMPFKDNYFDHIACLSTLEHIGMDNTMIYTENLRYQEQEVSDFEKAVLELKRVLNKKGKLFITVPFGRYENFGWFQQFDSKLINRVLKVFGSNEYKINYYKYTKEGWSISDEISCQKCKCFDVHKTKYFDKKSSLDFDSDSAAASRAVACLELIKQ